MKNDYPKILRRRARHAAPREQAEKVSTALQERNAACLLAWRVRWAQHRPLPDAWDEHWRFHFMLYYELAILHARRWMDARPAKRKTEREVVRLFGRTL